MSAKHYFVLLGCLMSAFVVHDLIRGSTGFRNLTFTRASQPLRYWAYLAVLAWLAATAFIAALRMGEE